MTSPNDRGPEHDDLDASFDPALLKQARNQAWSPSSTERPTVDPPLASQPSTLVTDDDPVTNRSKAAAEPTLFQFGRFEVKSALGRGTHGTVFRAYDPVCDRVVALKVPSSQGAGSAAERRFRREAKAASELHHPNIVVVYGSGQVQEDLYIEFEYVAGETLQSRLDDEDRSRPSLRESVAWVRDLARALDYAHGRGIVHRDIKPSNILLDASNRPRLADFGLARREDDATMTQEGHRVGTPAYMAPEQARGDVKAISARSIVAWSPRSRTSKPGSRSPVD